MSKDTVLVMNTVNGQVQEAPRSLITEPHFAKYHREVDEGTESYDPELYTPKTAEEFDHVHPVRDSELEEVDDEYDLGEYIDYESGE